MSSAKHFTEVLIGGKVYTLSGFEGEEYLQKVSSYLNHKITECANSEGYRKQSADTRNVLLALNIADDYFKSYISLSFSSMSLSSESPCFFALK